MFPFNQNTFHYMYANGKEIKLSDNQLAFGFS